MLVVFQIISHYIGIVALLFYESMFRRLFVAVLDIIICECISLTLGSTLPN